MITQRLDGEVGEGGVWDGTYGVVAYYPGIKTATYEQVGDYDFYIDRTMFDLFQELNGVK